MQPAFKLRRVSLYCAVSSRSRSSRKCQKRSGEGLTAAAWRRATDRAPSRRFLEPTGSRRATLALRGGTVTAIISMNGGASLFLPYERHATMKSTFFQLFERKHRARIDAENGHRRVTRPRLRIIVKETRGLPTGYLRAPSDAVKYDRMSRKFSTQHTNEP